MNLIKILSLGGFPSLVLFGCVSLWLDMSGILCNCNLRTNLDLGTNIDGLCRGMPSPIVKFLDPPYVLLPFIYIEVLENAADKASGFLPFQL